MTIDDENDCHSSQNEYQSYMISSQNERDWCLLFPETIQYDNTTAAAATTTTTTTTTTTKHDIPMLENHNNNNSPVSSVDAIDVITRVSPNNQKSISSSPSESSTPSSSSGDLIFEAEKLMKQASINTSKENSPVLGEGCMSSSTDEENVKTCSYVKPEEVLDNNDYENRVSSPSHSPPTAQEMHRDEEGYRIPATVFARSNSIAPADWSVASNDSLFSLHIGTPSIDREQSILINGELKTLHEGPPETDDGEACKSNATDSTEEDSDALSEISLASKSGEVSRYLPTTVINDVEDKKEVQRDNVNEEVPEIPTRKDGGIIKQHRQSVHSSSISLRGSNTSEDSNVSFAFPLLDEGEKNMTTIGLSQQLSHKPLVGKQQKDKHNTCCCCCCSSFLCLSCYNCCRSFFSWSKLSCLSCTPCCSSSCFSFKSCHFNSCCSWNLCSCCIPCKFCSCCTSKSTLLKCC